MGISREGGAHGWLRGTRLLFVCGLLAAPFGCDEAGCSKAQTSELRFFGRGGQVLAIKDTLNQATFSASQLGGLPSVPLTDLGSVDISGDYSLAPVDNQGLLGRQVEAHLFVADLAAMNEQLRFVGAAQPVSEWDALTGPRHMGGTAVLPFPPNPDWNTSIRYNPGPIFGGYFWPGVVPDRPASDPTAVGSVKSVRMYTPGLCSKEVRFHTPDNKGIFDTLSDTFFTKFSENGSVDNPTLVYSRVTTLLDDGVDIFGPKGGFFLYFWFNASAAFGLQNVNFTGNYEYQFTLDDGRVTVVPTRNDLVIQPNQAFNDFKDAAENQIPSGIHDVFVAQQVIGPPYLFAKCTVGTADPTYEPRRFLDSFVRGGGKALGYSDADRDRLSNAIKNPVNWFCGNDGVGRMIVRAKRLNIYGDALELVWFDRADVDDPMYALYVALVGLRSAGLSVSPSAFCERPRTIVAKNNFLPFVAMRPITTVKRPDPPEPVGHVFACKTEPSVNGNPLGSEVPLTVCADPVTPISEIQAVCAEQCTAKFSELMIQPLELVSSVNSCATTAPPSDTGFECRAAAEPRYFSGGPAEFRVEGFGTAEISGGATVHASLDAADLTIRPCSSASCPLALSRLELRQSGTTSFGTSTLSGLKIQSGEVALGTWLSGTNEVTFPTSSLSLNGSFDANGTHTSLEQTNPTPVRGALAPDGSSFVLSAQISTSGVPTALKLGGTATGHPPVAEFAPHGALECTQFGGSNVIFDAASSGDPDGDLRLFGWGLDQTFAGGGSSVPLFLPLGGHVIELDAFDSRGAASKSESSVTVIDTTPPTLAASADPSCLWPPNHKMVLYRLGDGLLADASDICDPAPKIEIVDVSSNQPVTGEGSGSTSPDVLFGAHGFCLRSERAGGADARAYTVRVEASDASGNRTITSVVVEVPHDRKAGQCTPIRPERVVGYDDPRCTQ